LHADIAAKINQHKSQSVRVASAPKKVKKPIRVHATSRKKMVKTAEIKPAVSQPQYDTLPPSSLRDTVAVIENSRPKDTLEKIEPQAKQAQLYTESQTKTFKYYPKSPLTIYSGPYSALDDVISYLDANPYTKVDILTYADSLDTTAENIDLSEKRVSDIRNYLIVHGVSEEKITVQIQKSPNFHETNQAEPPEHLDTLVEMTIR